MESLMVYTSDDDSDCDDENQQAENSQRRVIGGKNSCTTMTSYNFLGLETTKRNICQQGAQGLKETQRVQTSWGELEVPNGDFWKDLTPDIFTGPQEFSVDNHKDLQTFCQGSSSLTGFKHNSIKRGYINIQKNGEVLDSDHIKHSKQICRRHDQQSPESLSLCHIKRLSQSNDLHTHQIASSASSQNPGQVSEQVNTDKRKMFYIHSKVTPYMNSRPVNKCASRLVTSWPAHNGVVNRLAWSTPSFSHLLATAGMDSTIRIWNVWSSQDPCVASLSGHKKAVKYVEWCHSGKKVLSCSFDRTAQITDVQAGQTVAIFEHMGFVTASCQHPSNPNLFLTGTDNMVLKWDVRTPQAPVKCFSYKDKFGQVQDLLFINNGKEFISCSDLVSRDCADRSIMVWDTHTGTVLSNQIFQERYVCTRLKLDQLNSTFMAQTHGGYVALFSTTSPYKMDNSKRFEGHKVDGYSIGFDISPDTSLVYSGSSQGGIHCYHRQTGRLISKLPVSNDIITDVACHPVLPTVLASCSWSGCLSLWT